MNHIESVKKSWASFSNIDVCKILTTSFSMAVFPVVLYFVLVGFYHFTFPATCWSLLSE